LLLLLLARHVRAQVSIEQYHYFGTEQPLVWAPIVHYQNPGNWYAEIRYNYEDNRTLSLYTGRTFAHDGRRLSYSVTPLVGGVVGKFKGGSAGLNLELDFMNLFFESQSQYSFGLDGESADFIFSWSELGYRLQPWLFGGLSAQHTFLYQDESNLLEPGIFLGVEFGAWTFPLYSFASPGSDPLFVLGINFNPGK
jgi:hypothetical protein